MCHFKTDIGAAGTNVPIREKAHSAKPHSRILPQRGISLKVLLMQDFQTAASVLAHRLPHSATPHPRILPQRGIKMSSRPTGTRRLVLNVLMEEEKGTSYGSALIHTALDRTPGLTQQQRSFIKRLAEGCIGDKARLDSLIRHLSRTGRPPEAFAPALRCSLRMGLYQIFYMDAVPDAAAVDESVWLVREAEGQRAAGFANAVLRSAVRRKDELKEKIRTAKRPELRYSMPSWIMDLWTEQYGAKRANGIAEAFERIRPMSVRVDERLSESKRKELTEEWESSGITVQPSGLLPYAYELTGASDPVGIAGFREGYIAVQDTASMLVAEAAGIRGGERIVDVCASPGGKTLHCASKLAAAGTEDGSKGRVLSYDISEEKCRKIRENILRMRLEDFVSVSVRDASKPVPEVERGKADILILDLPCSGLGVLGRKREIRYRVKPEDIQKLSFLQKKILRNAVKYVRPGGTVLFSTCTINQTENDGSCEYIEKELHLAPDALTSFIPEKLRKSLYGTEKNRLQLFPDLSGTDGFFIARYVRPV